MVTEEGCVPVTGADAQAATLGEVGQVLLGQLHVLVDLVHALLHTLQLLWNTRSTPPSHTPHPTAPPLCQTDAFLSLYPVGSIQPYKKKANEDIKVRGGRGQRSKEQLVFTHIIQERERD